MLFFFDISLELSESMDFLELFFAPIQPFISHPGRIAVVAVLFGALFLMLGSFRDYWSWSLLWSTGFWASFAIWEWIILLQGANIRVDLFLIYPVLLVISVWSLIDTFRNN